MFGFNKKPTTVAQAIAGLVQAVDDLEAVRLAQAVLESDKRLEAIKLNDEADTAGLEANRASKVADKLREITEPKNEEAD